MYSACYTFLWEESIEFLQKKYSGWLITSKHVNYPKISEYKNKRYTYVEDKLVVTSQKREG